MTIKGRILYHKEIVNLAENSFVIFGMDNNSNACYQIFYYTDRQLMASNLVIVDDNDAIENGYIKLTKGLVENLSKYIKEK